MIEMETRMIMIFRSNRCRLERPLSPPSIAAVFPKKVFFPVYTTVASHSPRATVPPILANCLSPRVTGSDSRKASYLLESEKRCASAVFMWEGVFLHKVGSVQNGEKCP